MENAMQVADGPEIARETMLGDVVGAMLDEIRARIVWVSLSQDSQDDIIERVEKRARDIIKRVVEIVAADGRTAIPASVESVTVKDGIKAQLSLSRGNPHRHDLVDAQGQAVLIVISGAEGYNGGSIPKGEPDQRALGFDGGDDD